MMSSMSSEETLSRSCRLKTSTGTGVLVAVRPWRRVPTTIMSSSVSSTSCCAIAIEGDNAAKANMLVVRAKQAIGGFLLIIWPPPMSVEPVDYNDIFPGKDCDNLVALKIIVAERSTGIGPAIFAPIGDKANVCCESLEAGQLAHVAEERVPDPVYPDQVDSELF